MTKEYKLPVIIAGLVAVLLCSQARSYVQASSVAKENLPPVIVQEASSKEFESDRDKLNKLGNSGDLNGLLSTTDQLAKKWLIADKLSYYCILSAACSDLTSYDYGINNLSRGQNAAEKYAMDALNNGTSMSLGMRTFFVEHLTYAPGHGLSGPTGEDWSRLRSQRLTLWLGTWQQIRQRTVDNFSFTFDVPKLPPRKFISQRLIVDGVDPKNITDPVERKKYVDAWAKYKDNSRLAEEQADLHRVSEIFLPLAVKNIIAEYSAAPYDTSGLEKCLDTSLLAPDVSEEILTAVQKNIQHNTAVGK